MDKPEEPAKAKKRRGVQSVDMSGLLLEALCSFQASAPLKEIAAFCNIPAAKAHRYLTSLIRVGLASQDSASSRYDLGPLALRLGISALARDNVVKRTGLELEKITLETKTTGHITIWGENGPIVIRVEHGGPPVISSLGLGTSVPLLRSSSGHIFLSFMKQAAIAKVLKQELEAYDGGKNPVDAIISKTRRVKWSRVDGTLIPGLAAISGPVFNYDGSLACAITLISTQMSDINDSAPMTMKFLRFLEKINNGK
ncbi:MAG: IclR family transcriptional regulator [Kordiimonadaceae bacterium]|nr:IclR family transcriptional regulator [Kordiimonadaceae bacterium]